MPYVNTLRIILEQSVEWQAILYMTFIDFEKALDSVKREILWSTLQDCGISGKVIQIIKNCMISSDAKSTMKGSFLSL